MVATAGRPAALGFRRDLTFFLSSLFGFLIVIILVLVFLLQSLVHEVEASAAQQRNRNARAATLEINELTEIAQSSALDATLVGVAARFGIDRIELTRPDGGVSAAGSRVGDDAEVLEARSRLGPVVYRFDRTDLDSLRSRFAWTAAISLGAAVIGSVLLLLYVRRLSRPIEEMLADAAGVREREAGVEETHYLIDTFRSTIGQLRDQEEELKRLHGLEKARADELALVTATLTRSLTSGFLALDPDGTLIDMNEAAREILAVDPGQVRRSVSEVLGPSEFSHALEQASRQRKALLRNEFTIDVSGTEKVVGVSTVPLTNEDERHVGTLVLFTDLTVVRSLEGRLREMRALADLGEVSAGIAHEFRNSLSTILGYLKLARRTERVEEVEARLEAAEREAALLNKAVDGLLSFARPVQPDAREIELRELGADVIQRLKGTSGDDVEIRVEGPEVRVGGDPSLLARAVENVVRNAIEAVQRGGTPGTVVVRIEPGPPPALVIEDDGAGVDAEQISGYFLPFRSGRPGGFGLGLALARKIVLLHGGSISMVGRPEGGTLVRIELGDPSSLAQGGTNDR